MLDGVTSLFAWGLKNWNEELLDVTVAHNRRVRAIAGVRHHQVREVRDCFRTKSPHRLNPWEKWKGSNDPEEVQPGIQGGGGSCGD